MLSGIITTPALSPTMMGMSPSCLSMRSWPPSSLCTLNVTRSGPAYTRPRSRHSLSSVASPEQQAYRSVPPLTRHKLYHILTDLGVRKETESEVLVGKPISTSSTQILTSGPVSLVGPRRNSTGGRSATASCRPCR